MNKELETKSVLNKGKIDMLFNLLEDAPSDDRDEMISDWIVRYGRVNPIIEETDDPDEYRCLLLVKNQSGEYWENLYLVGDSFGWDIPQYEMTEVKGTRWWYADFKKPKGARIHYLFAPNEPSSPITDETRSNRIKSWLLDERNHRKADEGWINHSVMVLPGYEEVRNTETTENEFSDIYLRQNLDGKRSAKLTTISKDNETPEYLLITHDGAAAVQIMEIDKIIQAGVNEGRWPAIALLTLNTPTSNRVKEYGGKYGYPDYFADTIISAAEHHLGKSFSPDKIIASGTSLGAWAAFEVLVQRPDAVKNIISQSSPFWWPDEDHQKYIRHIRDEETIDVNRIYLDVGVYETGRKPMSTYDSNLLMANVLHESGYDNVMAREYLMGHRYQAWAWAFPGALDYIINGKNDHGPLPGRKMNWENTEEIQEIEQ